MNAPSIKDRLAIQSENTGIPIAELRRMCERSGLEALERGELKIEPNGRQPTRLEEMGGVSFARLTSIGSTDVVVAQIEVPISLLRDFDAYRETWGKMDIPSSIVIGSPAEHGDSRWHHPMTKRSAGVASKAERIQMVEALLASEPTKKIAMSFYQGEWAQICRRAEHHGISLKVHMLASLAYHAGLPAAQAEEDRRKVALREKRTRNKDSGMPVTSPFTRFEKALKAGGETANFEKETETPAPRRKSRRLVDLL